MARILVTGGTGFIGPFQVRYALERGHEVTLFNRGRTNRNMFPEVETLIGDRNRARNDLEPTVAFLCTRVTKSTQQ